uniref:condensation domain-containing protein n=1 Tax=Chitinophaga sp. TaxID=1869181 RepID=UPI0031D52100
GLRLVRSGVRSGFSYEDLSGVADVDVAAYRAADRRAGFDLEQGSQMRLKVLYLGGSRYEFIWSHHHIIMDGWCSSLLIREYFRLYEGEVLGAVYPYSDYIKWLEKRDMSASLSYWRTYLSGYDRVSALPKQVVGDKGVFAGGSIGFSLPSAQRSGLRELCMSLGITENIFLQTVWGILLGSYSGEEEVLYGTVVSGRPAELEGVEEMIGLFINTIPVRIRLEGEMSVKELLLSVQQSFIAGLPHHYTQLAAIQAQTPLKQGLFAHTLTFENFPVQEWMQQQVADKQYISNCVLTEIYDTNDYDFSIIVVPGEQLVFRFTYNKNAHEEAFISQIKDHFIQLITTIIKDSSVAIHPLQTSIRIDHPQSVAAENVRISNYTAGFSATVSDDF